MSAVIPYIIPVLTVLFAIAVIWRDPRRLRAIILSGVLLSAALNAAIGAFNGWTYGISEEMTVWGTLAQVLVVLLTIVVLAVLLIHSGLQLIRKEGPSAAHGLALALGIAILLYVAAAIVATMLDLLALVVFLLLLALPLYYLAFVLVAYLLYSAAYAAAVKLWKRRAQTVVVLGAGLQGDQVTPLLRARLDLGIESLPTAREIVVSGGQGQDEVVSEARAMANYLQSRGVQDVLLEDDSTTTAENLEFSAALLERVRGSRQEPWLVVSSDYHAMRAAMLLSHLKIRGHAVGARTPRYFWSSAVLREYIAILRDHFKVNLAILIILSLPILAWLAFAITS